MRTLVLKQAGRHPEALHQAELLDAQQDPRSAAILAGLLVEAGQATRAAALAALDEDTAVYLLHVVADDAPLAAMARGAGPAPRWRPRPWPAGAWATGTGPPGPGSWTPPRPSAPPSGGRRPSGLQTEPRRGHLALARWLLDHSGELFLPNGVDSGLGCSGLRDTQLPEPQRARLVDWLLRGTEAHRALEAYGAALANIEP